MTNLHDLTKFRTRAAETAEAEAVRLLDLAAQLTPQQRGPLLIRAAIVADKADRLQLSLRPSEGR